jgi:hypothetical protein
MSGQGGERTFFDPPLFHPQDATGEVSDGECRLTEGAGCCPPPPRCLRQRGPPPPLCCAKRGRIGMSAIRRNRMPGLLHPA